MNFCVGLTGGIGCGKSSVATLLAQHGASVIDTDEISHQLTQPSGAAISAIVQAFGNEFLDQSGAMNRAKMRAHIFTHPQAKTALEHILHPLIRAKSDSMLAQCQSPYVVLVVPLLLSSPDFLAKVQRVLVVDCPEDKQIKRVMARSGLTEAEVRNIISQQTPRTERLHRADDVLSNEASLDELKSAVAVLHQRYLTLAKQNRH